MKLITAVIKPFKTDDVREALDTFGGVVSGVTVTEVFGAGRQKGHTEIYRGAEYVTNLTPKTKIEILCGDSDVKDIMGIIAKVANTGKIGDGKIWVTGVEAALRIRTGETDEGAL